MDEQQQQDLKNMKKLTMCVLLLFAALIGVGIIAGVVTFNVFEGNATKGQLIIPIFTPMIIVAVAGGLPIRLMKNKMFPTKDDFERASKVYAEHNANKQK